VASYSYGPLGRRVGKVAGGVATNWVYDSADILRETRSDGTIYTYLHGPRADEPLTREDGSGARSYYHADGLGSVVKLTEQTGTVVQSYVYDAWGSIEVGASVQGFAFTGREWDAEVGLYYYRARYYDAAAGRFLSEDPIGFLGGFNLYRYVGDNPCRWTDPLGFEDPTMDELAIDLLRKLNGVSIDTSSEFGFAICEQNGKYFTTDPRTDNDDGRVEPSQCSEGRKVADCHTHGRYGNPGFSGEDIPSNIIEYVADPLGDIYKYDPNAREGEEVINICPGCAPAREEP